MIPSGSITSLEPTDDHESTAIAQLVSLDRGGRLYMLLALRCLLDNGQVITAEDWRTAFGQAADFQMVRDGREVLEDEQAIGGAA